MREGDFGCDPGGMSLNPRIRISAYTEKFPQSKKLMVEAFIGLPRGYRNALLKASGEQERRGL